jgi:gamma-glutamyltranspeptidase/glutathione hydrolase
VRPTGILANEAMVVSAREEASKLSWNHEKGGNALLMVAGTGIGSLPYAGNLGGGIYGL